MNSNKPETFYPSENVFYDRSNGKNYILHYRRLEFSNRHKMFVERVHNMKNVEEKPWLKAV